MTDQGLISPNNRRLKAVPVTREVIHGELFREGKRWKKVTKGVPEDAEFVTMHEEARRDVYYLIYRHEDWDAVPIGDEIPELEIEYDSKEDEEEHIDLYHSIADQIEKYREKGYEKRELVAMVNKSDWIDLKDEKNFYQDQNRQRNEIHGVKVIPIHAEHSNFVTCRRNLVHGIHELIDYKEVRE